MKELFFSEKHYKLKNDLREFLSEKVVPIKDEIDKKREVPPWIIKEIGKRGFIGPLIPKNSLNF